MHTPSYEEKLLLENEQLRLQIDILKNKINAALQVLNTVNETQELTTLNYYKKVAIINDSIAILKGEARAFRT